MKTLSLIATGLLLAALWCAPPAGATTLERFTFPALVDRAALIFQGEVTGVRTDEIDGLVYTWVRFRVSEVIKGGDPGGAIELRFLGGETSGRSVAVAGSAAPAAGERGIYFLDSPESSAVNPLLGWSQGRFLITGDDTDPAVIRRAPSRPPGPGLDKRRRLADKLSDMKFGRRAVDKAAAGEEAMTPADFKRAIRRQLEAGRQ